MCKKMSYIKKRICPKIASLVMALFCSLSFIAPAAYASGHNGEYPIAELTLGNSFGMKNIQRIGLRNKACEGWQRVYKAQ